MIEHISTEKIHDLLDGLLPATEETRIAEHLNACEACRRDVADMQEMLAALGGLPSMAEAPPEAWEGVARRIQGREPGTDHEVQVVQFPGAGDGRRRFHFTLPQLAAAAVVVSVLSAGAVWTALNGGSGTDAVSPVAQGVEAPAVTVAALESPGYAQAVAELQAVVDQGRDVLAPETVAALDEALATIDGALVEVREALEADPSSQLLGRMLVNHQRTRLRLLRQAAAAVQAVS